MRDALIEAGGGMLGLALVGVAVFALTRFGEWAGRRIAERQVRR